MTFPKLPKGSRKGNRKELKHKSKREGDRNLSFDFYLYLNNSTAYSETG